MGAQHCSQDQQQPQGKGPVTVLGQIFFFLTVEMLLYFQMVSLQVPPSFPLSLGFGPHANVLCYAMLCIKFWEFDGDLLTNNVEFLCVRENISPGKLVFRGHTGNSFLSGTLSHVFSCSLGATLPQKLSPMGHQSKQTSTTSKTSATSLSVFSGKKKTSWKKPRM